MPLIVSSAETEQPAFAFTRPLPWRYTTRGDRLFHWLSPRGDLLDLTNAQNGGAGYSVLSGVRGLDAADPELTTNDKLSGGSVAQHWRPLTREIFLPIRIEGASRAEFRTLKRNLLRAFNHAYLPGVMKPGVLTVTELDGTASQIEAYRAGPGLEGDESDEGAGPDWAHMGLLLHCPHPYWLDTVVRTITWEEQGAGFAFYPIYPLRVGLSRSIGETSAENPGDVEAYPLWEITGPCSSVALDNNTTGRGFVYNAPLGAGEALVIDTHEQRRTVRLASGTNVRANVATDSHLWSLAPGQNDITLTLGGSVAGQTRVVMTYRPQWEGAT